MTERRRMTNPFYTEETISIDDVVGLDVRSM